MSDSLQPRGLQHARLPCPSPSPRVWSNSSPLSRWCHPTISSSVIPFSSCPQSFPASGSFPRSWLFASGGQSIGASTSVLPVNIQGWFPDMVFFILNSSWIEPLLHVCSYCTHSLGPTYLLVSFASQDTVNPSKNAQILNLLVSIMSLTESQRIWNRHLCLEKKLASNQK